MERCLDLEQDVGNVINKGDSLLNWESECDPDYPKDSHKVKSCKGGLFYSACGGKQC